MLVITFGAFERMKTSAPRLNIFSATYPLMPLTKVTTAITAATPITTPSRVSRERSLFAHSDCRAMRMASTVFMSATRAGDFKCNSARRHIIEG